MKKEEIIGAIYPIPKEILDRSKKMPKVVYIKNVVHNVIPKKLNPGSKILFYVGMPFKKIFAEATIDKILFVDYASLRKSFSKEIIQKRNELKNYCGLQYVDGKSKKVSFVLKNFNYFEKGLDPISPITMTGKYFTREEEIEIKGSNS